MFAAAVGHSYGGARPSEGGEGQSMATPAGEPSIGTETLFRQTRPLHPPRTVESPLIINLTRVAPSEICRLAR